MGASSQIDFLENTAELNATRWIDQYPTMALIVCLADYEETQGTTTSGI